MKLPQLQGTILGHSLRTGSLFIGWISLVVGVILLIALSADFYYVMNNYEQQYRDGRSYRTLDEQDIKWMVRSKNDKLCEAAFGIAGSFSLIALCVLLLVGIYKRKPRFMLPSIFCSGAGLAFFAVIAFNEAYSYRGIDRIVFQWIVWGLIGYYCFLIKYGHYREIKSANENNVFSHQLLTHTSIISNSIPVKPTDNAIA